MNSLGVWLSPVLLMPGAALLIMSTSVRYARIHDELHHIGQHGDRPSKAERGKFLLRATLFRNALVGLYLSVALFSLAGLLGGLTSPWEDLSRKVVLAVTFLGILALVVGAWFLVRESIASLEVIRRHVADLQQGPHPD